MTHVARVQRPTAPAPAPTPRRAAAMALPAVKPAAESRPGQDGAADHLEAPRRPMPWEQPIPTLPWEAGGRFGEADGLRAEAEAIMVDGVDGRTATTDSALERDFAHLDADDAGRCDLAADFVSAHAGSEQAALDGLDPDLRERYEAVRAALGDQPEARMALQLLLLEGLLTGAPVDAEGQTLLDRLAQMATEPLAGDLGAERERLLGDLIQECAFPQAIAQKNRATCGATSVQMLLAMENPAEYARLVMGLAAETPADSGLAPGQVRLADGSVLTREVDTLQADDSGRTTSSRLIQSAFMEYANGEDDYQNDDGTGDDQSLRGSGEDPYGGLFTGQVDHLREGVFNRDFTGTDGGAAGIETVEAAVDAGKPAVMLINLSDEPGEWSGHYVVATRVEGDRVYYMNPWGQEESITQAELEGRLRNVNVEA